MTSTASRFFILSLITIVIWYITRTMFFTPFYNNSYSSRELSFDHSLSLDELKDALDRAYISANEILSKTESAKSILELEQGIKYLKEAIKERNILAGEKPDRLPTVNISKPPSIIDPKEVCPEKWEGRMADYPFFLKNIPVDPDCAAPPLKDVVTVIFNFVNEIPISKASTLFEDAAFSMYKHMTFIVFVPNGTNEIPQLQDIAKSKLPNMKIVEKKSNETAHGAILHEVVSEVKTKYVVITRNTERFDNFTAIVRLVRDISLGKAAVIGGSHRNTSGHWKAGCYQTKMLRGELGFDEGYDISDNSCMFCDYLSGPFGVKKDMFLEYLSNKKDSKLSKDFFYMQFFSYVRLKLQKRIYMCIDSMFYTETSGLLLMDKNSWQPFQNEMGISKVTFPDHKTSYEFKCGEVSVKCIPEKEKDLPFCCYKSAEDILAVVTKFLDEKKVQYQFHLPGIDDTFNKLFKDDVKKSTIVIGVINIESLNELKVDGFSLDLTTHELSSLEWRFVFVKDSNISNELVHIRFRNLVLPVNGNPGKSLMEKEKDKCAKDRICFNLLQEYEPLDSQRVWL